MKSQILFLIIKNNMIKYKLNIINQLKMLKKKFKKWKNIIK